jgi:hypothetical protein
MELNPDFTNGNPSQRSEPKATAAKFPLGRLVATANAASCLSPAEISSALRRHLLGDWGDLDEEDKQTNERALVEGTRLFSAYHAADGTKFWIITEWDRSVTTVLLPEDY